MTSPLLQHPGAVPADPPDQGVAAHYGDPLREQRALAAGEAIVDLSHRGVVRVTGADRLSWLHSLLSQHVAALQPQAPTQALVLDPQGRVEAHAHVVDDGAATWLHVDPGRAAALVAFLDSMRFLLRVDVADVSDEWAVIGEGASMRLIARTELPAYGSGQLAGVSAWEALRVARGEPRLGVDTDERTIPHEVGWLATAVHLDKGCYRGQETVARVHNLGRPPRRLVLLHLDGSRETLPPPGTDVMSGGTRVGRLGTAAHHYELGPIALALVKRTVADDVDVMVDDMNARVEALPGLSHAELNAPRVRPGADLRG